MWKKLLYHGSFATLGVSLLLGMAVLQANGRKVTDAMTASADNPAADASATDDSSAQALSPTDQAPAVDAQPASAAPVEAQVASVPAAVAAQPALVSAPATSPASAATSLQNAARVGSNDSLSALKSIVVFDSHRKTATRKAFKANAGGIRSAQAYCKRLAPRAKKHLVIKGEKKSGGFVTLTAASLKKYAQAVDEE